MKLQSQLGYEYLQALDHKRTQVVLEQLAKIPNISACGSIRGHSRHAALFISDVVGKPDRVPIVSFWVRCPVGAFKYLHSAFIAGQTVLFVCCVLILI